MSPGIELNTGKSNDLCILKNFWKHDIFACRFGFSMNWDEQLLLPLDCCTLTVWFPKLHSCVLESIYFLHPALNGLNSNYTRLLSLLPPNFKNIKTSTTRTHLISWNFFLELMKKYYFDFVFFFKLNVFINSDLVSLSNKTNMKL